MKEISFLQQPSSTSLLTCPEMTKFDIGEVLLPCCRSRRNFLRWKLGWGIWNVPRQCQWMIDLAVLCHGGKGPGSLFQYIYIPSYSSTSSADTRITGYAIVRWVCPPRQGPIDITTGVQADDALSLVHKQLTASSKNLSMTYFHTPFWSVYNQSLFQLFLHIWKINRKQNKDEFNTR
jgi:hypothetical protein